MGALVLLLLLAFIGWTIFVQFGARQQVNVRTALDLSGVNNVVNDAFKPMTWKRVNGPGMVNVKPKLRVKAPSISIDISPMQGGGSEVSIWTSQWTTRYGVMAHAQLAWRKKRDLGGRLTAVNPQLTQTMPAAPASPPPSGPHISSRPNVVPPPHPGGQASPFTSASAPMPVAPPAAAPRTQPTVAARSALDPMQALLGVLHATELVLTIQVARDPRTVSTIAREELGSPISEGGPYNFMAGPPNARFSCYVVRLGGGDTLLVACDVHNGASDEEQQRANAINPMEGRIAARLGGTPRTLRSGNDRKSLEAVLQGGQVVPTNDLR